MTEANYDLFGGVPPHVNGSKTSEQAAISVLPHVTRLASAVWDYIKNQGHLGATCCEVEKATGLSHQTASARIVELNLKGKIIDSGVVRKTDSGRNATVWICKA